MSINFFELNWNVLVFGQNNQYLELSSILKSNKAETESLELFDDKDLMENLHFVVIWYYLIFVTERVAFIKSNHIR